MCKTPALGGKAYRCTHCGQSKYVYFGCGNSGCPKCQGIKRIQWQDRIANKVLRCPYQHIVFSMPHQLNYLAKRHPDVLYNCLMRSAWSSLKSCCQDPRNLGALPGAIMVLHTFGSDLKYHVHVHALVTFGGIDNQNNWQWPGRKNKIVAFRQIRGEFRAHFMNYLKQNFSTLRSTLSFEVLNEALYKKAWCVHQEPPTANTKTIQEYLGKYICRIGLSKKRFHYDEQHKQVTLTYKDYRNKQNTEDRPPLATKTMHPLTAIHHILQHCLPAYFQKCRYYGLHASATYKKYKRKLPKTISNNGQTVRTVMQIIKAMLGLQPLQCTQCNHTEFEVEKIAANPEWIQSWLNIPIHNKDPVLYKKTYQQNYLSVRFRTGRPMPQGKKTPPI